MRPFLKEVSGLYSVVSVDPETSWAVRSLQEAVVQVDVRFLSVVRWVLILVVSERKLFITFCSNETQTKVDEVGRPRGERHIHPKACAS